MSKQFGLIAINLGMNIHDPKKINPNDFSDHLVSFYRTQPAGLSFLVAKSNKPIKQIATLFPVSCSPED